MIFVRVIDGNKFWMVRDRWSAKSEVSRELWILTDLGVAVVARWWVDDGGENAR